MVYLRDFKRRNAECIGDIVHALPCFHLIKFSRFHFQLKTFYAKAQEKYDEKNAFTRLFFVGIIIQGKLVQ